MLGIVLLSSNQPGLGILVLVLSATLFLSMLKNNPRLMLGSPVFWQFSSKMDRCHRPERRDEI